jgi:uncharacterized membrane protein YkgB
MAYDIRRTFLFYLDTKYRSSGTLTSPIFNFPNNLIGVENDERIRLTLQEMTMPYTFFQTETYNNKFLLTENGINRIVEIDIGNYNIITFILELTNKINTLAGLYTYIISYIAQTNTLNYIATPKIGVSIGSIIFNFNSQNVFDLLNIGIGESLNEMMGFDNDIYNLLLNTVGTAFIIESPIPITMSPGVENLYITINNSCENYANTNESNVFSTCNILGKIPIATPPFSKIFFYDINQNFATVITNKYLDNLSFTLYNERFTQITPRKDYSFTIKIEIIAAASTLTANDILNQMLELKKLKLISK